MTKNLQEENDTGQDDERKRFSLSRDSDGRNFLGIYTGTTHNMVELDEHEIARLQRRLTKPPLPMES
jgi:hypothetical protein